MRILAVVLLAGCSIPTPWQEQRNYAQSLKPAEVTPSAETPPPKTLRTFRLRAWVDDEYRTQTPRWEQAIAGQIERANAILTAQFGVRLEVESIKAWHRAGSANLEEPLEQLTAMDPGTDVDWVAGFVSSLAIFSAAQEQLGMARPFGRHFVLRGMFSAAEADAIARALNLLSEKDRAELARERQQHKEMAILLHEWAHTLGAFHERSPQWLMAPMYETSQSGFSEESARIVGLGLEHRKSPASFETWAKAYRAEVEKSAAIAWDAATREAALAAADRFFKSGGEPDALAQEDLKRFNDALALREKEPARALAMLAPLVEKYPRSEGVQGTACALATESPQLPETCRRAAALPAARAQLLLYVAGRLPPAEAIPLLIRAEAKASSSEEWLALAHLDSGVGLWSGAERAAAHAKGAEQIAADCARMKSFVGFPAEPLLPAREAEYVKSALAAHDEIDQRRYERALALAHELAAAFPGTPAPAVIECRALSRGKALSLTRSSCAAAAQAAPGAFYPQYILGLVASAESRWADAGAAMRRALEIDAGTPQVWSSLAAVELRLGHRKAAQDLSAKYERRFRAPLRPALWPAGWTAR